MEFRVLGPLGAVHDGEPVAIGGPRQQTVLALLLAFANRPVSIDRLVDEIWGEAPPPAAKNSLQSMVSKLRSAFPDGTATIERDGPGYSLKVDPGAIDAKVCQLYLVNLLYMGVLFKLGKPLKHNLDVTARALRAHFNPIGTSL